MQTGLIGAASLCMLGAASLAAELPPPLPAEHLTVEKLAPKNPHWVYVLDEAFFNEIDSRVYLFDGDSYRQLGQIDAGFNPGINLSPDGSTMAVGTTYFARGAHGARTDVVEFIDNSNLAVSGEIVLPPKRANTLPTYFNLAYSADGRFLYVAYVTPASSFGVLDPAKKSVLSEIDTAGCVLVIPSGPNRVSSLCENGRMLTVTLNADGHEGSRSLSEPFFDPDSDPVFVQGVPSNDGYVFLSFLGQVHEVDTSGVHPAFRQPWSIVTPAERDKEHWRPGGQTPLALQRSLGRLYVPMHRGGEGSHKDGGTEIWVFDVKTHQRLARWPMAPLKLGPAIAVQVSQDAAPLMFVATDKADVGVFDALSGHLKQVEKQQLGQTPWFFLNP
ncbi:MAG TPA: amine dehydrogenase large subunit [Steroidobacteraceae bacterium]|jgi:methylamine dehydrogenase heavy chain